MSTFSKALNIAAAIIILAIVGLFLFWAYSNVCVKEKITPPTPVTFIIEPTRINSKDTSQLYVNKKLVYELNKFKDTLQIQLQNLNQVKTEIQQSEQRNSDYYKVVLALIGVVFTIVGFFGFKSINDTRDNAIKSAISAAERDAREIAKTVAVKMVQDVMPKYIVNDQEFKKGIEGALDTLSNRIFYLEQREQGNNESRGENSNPEQEIRDIDPLV